MSKASKAAGNKASRKSPAVEAPRKWEEECEEKWDCPPCEWDCFVVLESELEKTYGGGDMVLGFANPAPQRVPVRVSLTVEIRPLNIFRRGGKWCMAFNFIGENGPSPVLAVECGGGRAPSLDEAASLFYGGVPECVRTGDKTGSLEVRPA